MNYSELSGQAHFYEWAAKAKEKIDAKNAILLENRQRQLDRITGIKVGDFVDGGDKPRRVAYDWGDAIQLTDGEFGASFYLGSDGHCDFSGGLNPSISKEKFRPIEERREGSVWFFSGENVEAHNGYHTTASFRVWTIVQPQPQPQERN